MPVWIRLSGLPMEWMELDLLWLVGGLLGSMCKVDPITESQERSRFARIYVEVDVSQPLYGMVKIDGRRVKVEYENMGLICYKCGRLGHSQEACKEGMKANQEEDSMVEAAPMCENMKELVTEHAIPSPQKGVYPDKEVCPHNSVFGPWMSGGTNQAIGNNGGLRKEKAVINPAGSILTNGGRIGGSRFNVLDEVSEGDFNSAVQQAQKRDTKLKGTLPSVLSQVPNLKVKPRHVKKMEKTKADTSSGVNAGSQKKQDGCVNNTEEIGVLQQLHQDIVNAMGNGILDCNMEVEQSVTHVPEISIEDPRRVEATSFDGSGDPDSVHAWLNDLERVFGVIGYSDEHKFSFAIFLLKDRAYDWWLSVQQQNPVEVSWNEFKRKFEEGLRHEIKTYVSAAEHTEYGKLVESALRVERNINEAHRFDQQGQKRSNQNWLVGGSSSKLSRAKSYVRPTTSFQQKYVPDSSQASVKQPVGGSQQNGSVGRVRLDTLNGIALG
ncbi:hypothetical protein JRO89_XS08G0079500 [Xanthoceras sorbifolium]|uniref:CCHC-type domain-containing protein n=1 Tax=Xanthoceras sorbifolium TaxID=99658 RepID=A0ABQ8HP07_9ROSI|nr:hypothetical protein JRO89_XS08G0079500 [Xanthoceras sorbifolium]